MARPRKNADVDYIQTIGPLALDDSEGWSRLAAMCEDVFLSAIYDDLGYSDPSEVRPIQWIFCISQVGEKIFKQNKRLLKVDDLKNNSYDIDKLIKAYNIYYYISCKYNVEISINKYCYFTGIEFDTIENVSAKPGGFDLRRKISKDSEEFWTMQLSDKKINPIGTLAKLNRWHNWKETASGETSVNITLSESPAALADRYRAKIADTKAGLLSDDLTDSDAETPL